MINAESRTNGSKPLGSFVGVNKRSRRIRRAGDIDDRTVSVCTLHVRTLEIGFQSGDEPMVHLPVKTDLTTTNESARIRRESDRLNAEE